MGAYEALLIRTCKKRGCVATGGMAPNLSKNVRADDKATYAKVINFSFKNINEKTRF